MLYDVGVTVVEVAAAADEAEPDEGEADDGGPARALMENNDSEIDIVDM